jgi:cyanate lyase
MKRNSRNVEVVENLTDIIKLREEKEVTYRAIGIKTGIKTQKVIRMFLGYQDMSKDVYRKILKFLKEGK